MSINPKQINRALKLFRALAKSYFANHPFDEEDEESNAAAAAVEIAKPVEELVTTKSSFSKKKKKDPSKKREREEETQPLPPPEQGDDTNQKKPKKEQGPFTCPGRLWEDDKPSCPGGEGADVLDRSRYDGHIRDTCKVCKRAFQKFKNAEKKKKKKEEEAATTKD